MEQFLFLQKQDERILSINIVTIKTTIDVQRLTNFQKMNIQLV
jgi:hypothetical protein